MALIRLSYVLIIKRWCNLCSTRFNDFNQMFFCQIRATLSSDEYGTYTTVWTDPPVVCVLHAGIWKLATICSLVHTCSSSLNINTSNKVLSMYQVTWHRYYSLKFRNFVDLYHGTFKVLKYHDLYTFHTTI